MSRPPRIASPSRENISPGDPDLPDDDLISDSAEDEFEDATFSLPEPEAEETAPASVARGVDVIKSHEKHAPNGPGVYRMISGDGEVLYVGKARSIKKRIGSYARGQGHSNRIARMISLTASMVFVLKLDLH